MPRITRPAMRILDASDDVSLSSYLRGGKPTHMHEPCSRQQWRRGAADGWGKGWMGMERDSRGHVTALALAVVIVIVVARIVPVVVAAGAAPARRAHATQGVFQPAADRDERFTRTHAIKHMRADNISNRS